jgi:hypothetical protein
MRSKIKLNPGEDLKRESSKTKGFMAETDITEYSVVDRNGDIIGSVIHEEHMSINGFKITNHVTQRDKSGKEIVQASW